MAQSSPKSFPGRVSLVRNVTCLWYTGQEVGVVLGVGLVIEDGQEGGVQTLDSLGDRGYQLLVVADWRGAVLVAWCVLGGDVRTQKGLAIGDSVLWVHRDASIIFNVLGAAPSDLGCLQCALVAPRFLYYV